MGEAKRKLAQQATNTKAFLSRFTGDAATIASVAYRFFDRFIVRERFTGGCYFTTFFLKQVLLREYGIKTEAVVGYVNDGEGAIMASHAWLEFNGKKTDLTLHVVDDPSATPPGDVVIMGEVLKKGVATYTYHHEPDDAAMNALSELRRMAPELGSALDAKEVEHAQMKARTRDESLMDAYLRAAPYRLDRIIQRIK